MDDQAPTIVIPICVAAKKAPCPHCGKHAKRIRRRQRFVRTIAYHAIASLEFTYGEYKAGCGCCVTFHTTHNDVLPKAKYDNKVRQAVLDRIIDDGMNVEAALRSLRRDFLLELSTGFVYDCLHHRVAQLDMASHRQRVRQVFSGTLCVDELHRGQQTLLLATDPITDIPVAFALVKSNAKDHMGRFLSNLAHGGLEPNVVITDGSNLYPELLAKLWPEAEHQLCVFHVMQDINKQVLDALKRLRRSQSRNGNRGRKRKRGRPSNSSRSRRGPTQKDKAHFVFKHRYLIVKREENLSDQEKKNLRTMLEYLPSLSVRHRFSGSIYRLFRQEQCKKQAKSRLVAMRAEPEYLQVKELKDVLEKTLTPKKFEKIIAFLGQPAGQRLRTNNPVERCNRKLRYMEKVRYKWRQRRTLVRFMVLALDHWWNKAWQRLGQEPGAKSIAKPMASADRPSSACRAA